MKYLLLIGVLAAFATVVFSTNAITGSWMWVFPAAVWGFASARAFFYAGLLYLDEHL